MIEKGAGRPLIGRREVVFEEVPRRIQPIALPHDVDGIDFVSETDVAIGHDPLGHIHFTVQASVDVEHHPPLLPSLGFLGNGVHKQPFQIFFAGPIVAPVG